jgi:signal transduction histidine kinase
MLERNWKKMSIARRSIGLWRSNFLFAGILLICGIIPFVSISLASGFPLTWQLKHEAFHAVMETLGCMLALGIAGFLLMRQGEKGNEYKLWLACSMLSMAILDAFHASVAPSREFICLHSTAQFIGGVLIALIWLPERLVQTRNAKQLPKLFVAAAGLFGVISLVFPEILPAMMINGRFTFVPQMLNLTGGVLFFAGLVYFASRFSRDRDNTHLLFAAYCLMFAVSGVTFGRSGLWGAEWWLSHLIRLGAYVIAFSYVSINTAAEYLRLTQEEALDKINKCFLSFGPNPDNNINKIVETAGLIFKGTCALYSKEEGALLCIRGGWNIPEDFKLQDNKEGHICYDVISNDTDEPFVITGLDETPYAKTDPNVNQYKLKTYVGCAVKVHDKAIGALCVVFQKNKTFNSQELKIFYILAEALGVEEERKKAEEVLEKLNTYLKSIVRELRRANKELQEFAYITAHDLKTPLRGIGTLAEWLSTDYADKFDEQGQKQVKMLTERAKRADKLVDSILQYSSIGQLKEEQEQLDLNMVLHDIICEIEPSENINITVESKLPVLMCKKTHIGQVFHNLLSNAVKHMDKEKGQIKVGCTEKKGFWKFSVADNGPGIDKKYFKKIFKIFQTLVLSDETESTGIGLSIAKKIVNMNAGRIWVESEVGKGSTFFFTLPKQETEAENKKLQANIVS